MKCNTQHVSASAAARIEELAKLDRYRPRHLDVSLLHDVVMVPIVGYAGLYQNGRAIPESYFSCAAPMRDVLSDEVVKDATIIDEPVFYLGKFNVCWGHCITDHLKFLWPFLDISRYSYLNNCKLVYTTLSRDSQLPENYLQILEAFGIGRSRLLKINAATKLRKCYFADECFSSVKYEPDNEHYYAQEYCDIVEHICSCSSKVAAFSKKLYLTRTGWNGWVKGEYGENLIERAFESSGFEIIHPERVPFSDFVSMLYNADVIAATECSCSHNALFMHKGAQLVLLRKYDRVNSYQMTINQVRNLDVHYVDVGKTILIVDHDNRSAGPFFMYVTAELADYLGVRSHFPALLFLRYLFVALWLKIYGLSYNISYRIYKQVVVRWLGITLWERGKII